jgi:hypothetical protein
MLSQLVALTRRVPVQHQEAEEATCACPFEGTSAATLYSLLRAQPLAHTETELRRRRWLLAWFLMRDPFYRQLFWCVYCSLYKAVAPALCSVANVAPSSEQKRRLCCTGLS